MTAALPELDLRVDLTIEPACETAVACGNTAAYAVRLGCGCLILACQACLDHDRTDLAQHEAEHPTCRIRWHCARCGAHNTIRAPGLFDQIFVTVVPL